MYAYGRRQAKKARQSALSEAKFPHEEKKENEYHDDLVKSDEELQEKA